MEEDYEDDHGEYSYKAHDVDELTSRIEKLEDRLEKFNGNFGVTLPYFSGMALAMILSWSRNGDIFWCIQHGLVSWIYVISRLSG